MCNRNTRLYASILISIIIAVVLGVLAGIFSSAVFANTSLFFRILLLISSVVLLISTLLLYNRSSRSCISGTPLKIIMSYLLFGVIGSFISSSIGLTLAVAPGAALSVLLGLATFFALSALAAAMIQLGFLLNSTPTK